MKSLNANGVYLGLAKNLTETKPGGDHELYSIRNSFGSN